MEKVDGRWLMSDFDGHKQACIRHIEINRREQAVRQAMSDYLVKEIGAHYLEGQLCIPTLLIVAEEEVDSVQGRVWCDCWVDWYNVVGDTLETVSGGNHAGCMTIQQRDGKPVVTAFEQVEDGALFQTSAKRIFGQHFDVFQNMNSNRNVREAAQKEQLGEYVKCHKLSVRYYQNFGWDAVVLQGE
jgi:hypothetical protein